MCLYQSKVEDYSKPNNNDKVKKTFFLDHCFIFCKSIHQALIALQFQPKQELLTVLMYKVQLQGRSWEETKRIYLKTTFICDKTKKSIRIRRNRQRLLLDFSEEMRFHLEKNFLIKTCLVRFELKENKGFLERSSKQCFLISTSVLICVSLI